jgi:putative FmdB family regulatory protein
MPIFDYQCSDCGATYDIFHKVREVTDDVVCPSCTSKNHKRLISAPNISTAGGRNSDFSCGGTDGGGCAGGLCGLN